MMINFLSPKEIPDFTKFCKYLDTRKMLKDLQEIGELKTITADYGNDVYNLCHNSVGWIIKQLAKTHYIYEIKVATGRFQNKDHSWLIVGNYNVDLTLAQFINCCPELAITSIEDKIGYEADSILDPFDWVEAQNGGI
jgi:hypothetical protein